MNEYQGQHACLSRRRPSGNGSLCKSKTCSLSLSRRAWETKSEKKTVWKERKKEWKIKRRKETRHSFATNQSSSRYTTTDSTDSSRMRREMVPAGVTYRCKITGQLSSRPWPCNVHHLHAHTVATVLTVAFYTLSSAQARKSICKINATTWKFVRLHFIFNSHYFSWSLIKRSWLNKHGPFPL